MVNPEGDEAYTLGSYFTVLCCVCRAFFWGGGSVCLCVYAPNNVYLRDKLAHFHLDDGVSELHLQQLGVRLAGLAGFGGVGREHPQHAHVAAHHDLIYRTKYSVSHCSPYTFYNIYMYYIYTHTHTQHCILALAVLFVWFNAHTLLLWFAINITHTHLPCPVPLLSTSPTHRHP